MLCHPAGQRSPLLHSWEISAPLVFWAKFPPLLQHGFCPSLLRGQRVTQIWPALGQGHPLPPPALFVPHWFLHPSWLLIAGLKNPRNRFECVSGMIFPGKLRPLATCSPRSWKGRADCIHASLCKRTAASLPGGYLCLPEDP